MATRLIVAEELRGVNGDFKPQGTLGRHHMVVIDSGDGVDVFRPRISKGVEHVLYYKGLELEEDVLLKDGKFFRQMYLGGEFICHARPGDVLVYDCGEVHKLPRWRAELYRKVGYCPVTIVTKEALEDLKKTRPYREEYNSYGRCVGKHGRECTAFGEHHAVLRKFIDSPCNCGRGSNSYFFDSVEEAKKYFGLIPGGKPKEYIGPAPRTNIELVHRTETHSIGGGEWSIEVYDIDGFLLKEFVGSNGTQRPADDLWAAYEEWAAKPEW